MALINETYKSFTEEIHHLCDILFPQYLESSVRKQVDSTLILQSDNPSTTASIRAFKRAHRGNQIRIEARDETRSALEEAEDLFRNLFKNERELAQGCVPLNMTEPFSLVFSPQDVEKAIRSYASHKSGGIDGLHTVLFKHLINLPDFKIILSNLFQLFYVTGCTPSQWNESKIHLIPKDRKEPFINKCRPISLTQCLRRYFEKILLRQFEKELHWTRIEKHQAGFRTGFSAMSQIMAVDEWTRRGKPISLFLDLKSAYDLCSHRKMLKMLKKRGCPKRNINLIFSLMMNECVSSLTVNQLEGTNWIKREQGLFQGSILSPFLFNLFIDSLSCDLNDEMPDCAWLFADDICIKAKNEKEMERCIAICERWAKLNGMVWNLSKCGIMGSPNDHLLDSKIIPKVTRYKYLGTPFEKKGVNWLEFNKCLNEKQKRLLNALKPFKQAWSIKTKLTVFKSFIRSSGEYCVPNLHRWIAKQPEEMKKELKKERDMIHEEALAWILNSRNGKTIHQSVTGIGSADFRISCLLASFCRHMSRMSPLNPVNVLIQQSTVTTALKKDSFIHTISNHPWWTEYRDLCKLKEDASFRTFIRNKWLQENEKISGVLCCYINNSVRLQNLVDPCIFQPSKETSQMFANWRINTLCFNKGRCPDCKEMVKRTCFENCSLLNEMEDIQAIKESEMYQKEKEIMIGKIQNRKKVCNFGVMDFCLNRGWYELTARALQKGLSALQMN
jgi:hypothetical protein